MPRAPRSGRLSSLLLMAGLAFAATFTSSSSLLSDDDIDVDASSVVVGVDGAPKWKLSSSYCSTIDDDTLCPPPCQTSDRSKQCLHYLQDSHKEEVCGRDVPPQRRRDVLHRLRMPHCCEHAVDKALPEAAFHGDSKTCHRLLTNLQDVDNIARSLSCTHADLLTRYDCSQNYSIVHHCKDCKEAYRRWVCSSLVPHYTRSGERKRMRPCLRVCQDVEQQCPYLLPDQTVSPGEAAHPTPQYAGEPTFLCLDPNIPETGEQRLKSSRGDEDCCYQYCASSGRGAEKRTDEDIERKRGDGRHSILSVCEHCPGRPPNSTTLAPSRGGATLRTFNKVFLLWTAWIILLQTERLIYLLVMCEYGIRTMIRCSNDWRHSCS